jgi:hypothetical protein
MANDIDKELKTVLIKRGFHFSTDTDTEAVAMLCKYVWESQPHKRLDFTELIKTVVKELVRDSSGITLTGRKDPLLSSSSRRTSRTRWSALDEDPLCLSVSRRTES